MILGDSMSKEDLVRLVLEIRKHAPLDTILEEYIYKQVKLLLAFEPNAQELEKDLKEILELMRDPQKLEELTNLVNDGNEKNIETNEAQLIDYLIDEMKNKTKSLERILEDVNQEVRSQFIRRVIGCLEENKVNLDEQEMLMILRMQNRENDELLLEQFETETKISSDSDLMSALERLSEAKNDVLSNNAIMKRYSYFGESLYLEIVEYLKSVNLQDVNFREHYYDVLIDLKKQTRIFEELYVEELSNSLRKLGNEIDWMIEDIQKQKQTIVVQQEQEFYESSNAKLFK